MKLRPRRRRARPAPLNPEHARALQLAASGVELLHEAIAGMPLPDAWEAAGGALYLASSVGHALAETGLTVRAAAAWEAHVRCLATLTSRRMAEFGG